MTNPILQTPPYLEQWQKNLRQNILFDDNNFIHSVNYYFPKASEKLAFELEQFGKRVADELEPLVNLNNQDNNLPQLQQYNNIGERIDKIIHHPSYIQTGDIIYSSNLMQRMTKDGGLLESLLFLYLSSHAGEAGHNCPIACSAGIIRLLNIVENFPFKDFYLKKLTTPSFTDNFTGAQFITEIQGGSDVGSNLTSASQDDNNEWRISGTKWFCSNANAELFLVSARHAKNIPGTKGLALFLVPAQLEDGGNNHFTIRRLKSKIGTRSLATAEIDFVEAKAYLIGDLDKSFNLLMENVLHISRIFNTFAVLGIAHRAFQIANLYAKFRNAFGHPILDYPLVKQNLATIKAEHSAIFASICKTTKMQDDYDSSETKNKNTQLLLRLLVNLNKYFSAQTAVDHIHHSLDILAGNGAIEDFSPIPRLLKDSIVCENWEGTHYTLWMQVLRDIHKYQVDTIFINFIHLEIALITQEIPEIKILNTAVNSLENQLRDFKKADPEVQSLQIKNIVDQMIVIYCSLCLLQEGLDQKTQDKRLNKLDCLQYFNLLHLQKTHTSYDKNFLQLISRILK